MPRVSDAQIHAAIRQHRAAHDRPPTLQQIADALGYRSTAGVHYRLGQIDPGGLIVRRARRR